MGRCINMAFGNIGAYGGGFTKGWLAGETALSSEMNRALTEQNIRKGEMDIRLAGITEESARLQLEEAQKQKELKDSPVYLDKLYKWGEDFPETTNEIRRLVSPYQKEDASGTPYITHRELEQVVKDFATNLDLQKGLLEKTVVDVGQKYARIVERISNLENQNKQDTPEYKELIKQRESLEKRRNELTSATIAIDAKLSKDLLVKQMDMQKDIEVAKFKTMYGGADPYSITDRQLISRGIDPTRFKGMYPGEYKRMVNEAANVLKTSHSKEPTSEKPLKGKNIINLTAVKGVGKDAHTVKAQIPVFFREDESPFVTINRIKKQFANENKLPPDADINYEVIAPQQPDILGLGQPY